MDTLNTFFETQQDSPEWANSLTNSDGISKAKQAIQKELGGFHIPQVFYEQLIKKLCQAMDLEIGDLLVKGFKKHQEILQYRHKQNPASGDHKVDLMEHTFVSKHSPRLIVLVHNQEKLTLEFQVTLKLKFSGGRLYIRDGMIVKASTGSCQGSGTIDFEGLTVLKKDTAWYNLPGEIPFDPGIAI